MLHTMVCRSLATTNVRTVAARRVKATTGRLRIQGQTRPSRRHLPDSVADNSPCRAIAEDDYSTDDVFDVVNENVQGAFWDGVIWKWNRGGVIVKAGDCKGFMPYGMMDATRLEGIVTIPNEPIDGSTLLKQKIKCIVKRIGNDGKAVVSEQEYLLSKLLDHYKPGDVITVKVTAIEAYGVFVQVPSEDGRYHGIPGFIHKSELAWDFVARPETVVQIGDEVEAFVKEIKRYQNRIELSLRHDHLDPLKESISSLLPLGDVSFEDMTWEKPESVIPELDLIMEKLELEPGIRGVQPARQAEVQHKVSLDLELWLSKDEVVDGFTLVAWSGRTLQEIHVQTNLTREEMKDTLRAVLRRTM